MVFAFIPHDIHDSLNGRTADLNRSGAYFTVQVRTTEVILRAWHTTGEISWRDHGKCSSPKLPNLLQPLDHSDAVDSIAGTYACNRPGGVYQR